MGAADRKYFFPMLIEEIPNIRALRTLSQAKHEGQYSPLPSRQHKPAPLIAPNLVVRSQNKRRRHGRLYRGIEAAFDALLAGYQRTLDIVLRYQAITLLVFLTTLGLTVLLMIQIPKGFIPIQDTGMS